MNAYKYNGLAHLPWLTLRESCTGVTSRSLQPRGKAADAKEKQPHAHDEDHFDALESSNLAISISCISDYEGLYLIDTPVVSATAMFMLISPLRVRVREGWWCGYLVHACTHLSVP